MIFNKDKKIYIDKDGYRYIPWQKHFDKTFEKMFTRGYAPEHRFNMALHLGRPLEKHEHVHHLNKNRTDNSPENLEIHDVKNHIKLHIQEGGLKLFTTEYQPKKMKKKADYILPMAVGASIGAGYKAWKASKEQKDDTVLEHETIGQAALKGALGGGLAGLGYGGVKDYLARNKNYKNKLIKTHDRTIEKTLEIKKRIPIYDIPNKWRARKYVKELVESRNQVARKKFFSPLQVFKKKASNRELDPYTKFFLSTNKKNKTITSDKLVRDVKRRHKLDLHVAPITTSRDDVFSGYATSNDVKKVVKEFDGKIVKYKPEGPSKIDKLFKQEHVFREDTKAENDLRDSYRKGRRKKHGVIVVDKDTYKNNPEITAHELGHAITYSRSPLGPVLEHLRGGKLGNFIEKAAPAVSIAANIFPKIPNKKLALMADVIGLLPGAATLTDEVLASYNAIKEIKKSGGTPNKMTLVKPFLTYAMSHLPNFIAAGLTLSQLHTQNKFKKKYPAIFGRLKQASDYQEELKNMPGKNNNKKLEYIYDSLQGRDPKSKLQNGVETTNDYIDKAERIFGALFSSAKGARYGAGLFAPRSANIKAQNTAVKYSPIFGLLGAGGGIYASKKVISPFVKRQLNEFVEHLSKSKPHNAELYKKFGRFFTDYSLEPAIIAGAAVGGSLLGSGLLGAGIGIKERLKKKDEDNKSS